MLSVGPDRALSLQTNRDSMPPSRIEITRLEGKGKLNQIHPQERRDKIAASLHKQGDENSLALAAMMTAVR